MMDMNYFIIGASVVSLCMFLDNLAGRVTFDEEEIIKNIGNALFYVLAWPVMLLLIFGKDGPIKAMVEKARSGK